MQKTITLTASARYGYEGKQYIARITGRDSKFTFSREFVGRKGGKRREDASYVTDEPGLYITCDLDSKGRKDETYWVVEQTPDDGMGSSTCSQEEAMELAHRLDKGERFEDAVRAMWPPKSPEQRAAERLSALKAWLKESIERGEPEKEIGSLVKLGITFGPGTRLHLQDAIRAEIARREASVPDDEAPTVEMPSQSPPNPLAGFSNDEIMAEFLRRGMSI